MTTIHTMHGGYSVASTVLADTVEFETTNPAGETISTVYLPIDDAIAVLNLMDEA